MLETEIVIRDNGPYRSNEKPIEIKRSTMITSFAGVLITLTWPFLLIIFLLITISAILQ